MGKLRLEEMAAFDWSALDLGWAGRWWWFLRVYGLKARFGELLRLTFFADFLICIF